MTQILSCLTPEYVLQVSDRRVSFMGARPVEPDDIRNKVINYCHRFAISFTGLAEIGGLRTDSWMANVMSKAEPPSISGACEALHAEATSYFRKLQNRSSIYPLVLVGVGWAIPAGESEQRALFVRISNCYDSHGNLLGTAQSEFTLIHAFLQPHRHGAINVSGRPLSDVDYVELRRDLRRFGKKQFGPGIYIDRLARAIRSTATAQKDVGQNLMAICLPREKSGAHPQFFVNDISGDAASFSYLAADANELVSFMPTYVCAGTILANGKVTVRGSETDASISLTLPDKHEGL